MRERLELVDKCLETRWRWKPEDKCPERLLWLLGIVGLGTSRKDGEGEKTSRKPKRIEKRWAMRVDENTKRERTRTRGRAGASEYPYVRSLVVVPSYFKLVD